MKDRKRPLRRTILHSGETLISDDKEQVCVFCGAKVADTYIAVEEGWSPYFYDHEDNEHGPCCGRCSVEHLVEHPGDREDMLKEGHRLPFPAGTTVRVKMSNDGMGESREADEGTGVVMSTELVDIDGERNRVYKLEVAPGIFSHAKGTELHVNDYEILGHYS